MIKEIKGSVFDQEADVICHQANCFNKMKSGLAAEVARRYPEAVEADNRTDPGDKFKLGSYTCGVGDDGTDCVKTDYNALKKALMTFFVDYITSYVATMEPLKVAIPKNMGCGLGGGIWDVVRGIVEDLFGEAKEFLI